MTLIPSFNDARSNVLVWREPHCGRHRLICSYHSLAALGSPTSICALILLPTRSLPLHFVGSKTLSGQTYPGSIKTTIYFNFRGYQGIWNICGPWFRSRFSFSCCLLFDQKIENFIRINRNTFNIYIQPF